MPIDELREDDLPALQRLVRACLEADGGLPAFADSPLCGPGCSASRPSPSGTTASWWPPPA